MLAQRKYEKYFYSREMTAVLNRIRIKGIRSHLHFLLTRTFVFFFSKAHAVPNPRRFPATARVPLSRACREYRVNFLIETHTHTYKETYTYTHTYIHTCTRRKWQRREINETPVHFTRNCLSMYNGSFRLADTTPFCRAIRAPFRVPTRPV